MIASKLTVIIITHNEEANIGRVLERLGWAGQVLILDSFSTDRTLEIARKFPNVRVEQRKFDDFAAQCNHALGLVATEWVLSLDADYRLTEDLVVELRNLKEEPGVDAYNVRFRYCVYGRPLRAALLPPRPVLFRRASAAYEQDGHAHRLRFRGQAKYLKGAIDHDDRKPLSRWLSAQDRYAAEEAAKLRRLPSSQLDFGDRLRRRVLIAPFAILFYCLFFKGLVLDGWRGVFYSFQRAVFELWLSVRLIEDALERRGKRP